MKRTGTIVAAFLANTGPVFAHSGEPGPEQHAATRVFWDNTIAGNGVLISGILLAVAFGALLYWISRHSGGTA